MKPRVLALVVTLREYPSLTISSLQSQTISPTIIIVSGENLNSTLPVFIQEPDMRYSIGERVSRALNHALSSIDLLSYDYILKADSDVYFLPKFLESHTASGYDAVGKGDSLLIKVEPFLEVLGGRFFETIIDDSYIFLSLEAYGYKTFWGYVSSQAISKTVTKYSLRRLFQTGFALYRCGQPCLIFLANYFSYLVKNPHQWKHLFVVLGFVFGVLRQPKKYPISYIRFEYVLRSHSNKLAYLDKILGV